MTGDRKSLKLYIVSCHVDKELTEAPPVSEYDAPIQAGAALTGMRTCLLNDFDDCEDNISDRNRRYSEATAMYWISKHIESDYVGIVHYRRRLGLTDLQLNDYMNEDVDIITTVPIDLGISIEEDYRRIHYSRDWDLFMEIIKRRYPEDYEFAAECFRSNKIHACNINIFKAPLYKDFCEWAFPIMDEFWQTSSEKTDIYQHRDVGFIAERLSHLYVMKMVSGKKNVVEAPLRDLSSGEWNCKNECDYNNIDDVYNTCNRLYQLNQITKCCNVVGESVRRGKVDKRIKLLSEIMVAGILEREKEFQTMHDYLPAQFRKDLDTLVFSWNSLKKALSIYMSLRNNESAEMLENILGMTRFSMTAQREAVRHIREEEGLNG